MSIYRVDEHHRTHTCPADPDPHPIDIARTVVHITEGRPCLAPVTIRCGNRTVSIACSRQQPAHRQCSACRTVITVGTITVEHLGAAEPCPRATIHTAPTTCSVCGEPLNAVLADWGTHLLCHPRTAHAPTREAAA
ncbi:hypothetical protein OHA72_18325 [Dactylosporangium sp. NBC_01737]|uniref:hypothetical protein n=1 Tax=Dactylosporangium sp. NBC_01737 TaxID=2975959 RepID=UPI002E14931C|nr:hypothetical protein OHA72_18325 [Dactylosporangium sp. NBC_01737]